MKALLVHEKNIFGVILSVAKDLKNLKSLHFIDPSHSFRMT